MLQLPLACALPPLSAWCRAHVVGAVCLASAARGADPPQLQALDLAGASLVQIGGSHKLPKPLTLTLKATDGSAAAAAVDFPCNTAASASFGKLLQVGLHSSLSLALKCTPVAVQALTGSLAAARQPHWLQALNMQTQTAEQCMP